MKRSVSSIAVLPPYLLLLSLFAKSMFLSFSRAQPELLCLAPIELRSCHNAIMQRASYFDKRILLTDRSSY